jgi:adenylate kinase
MLNLVLFGPPGAGKGTQAMKLLVKYQLVHLSTGDLLRSEIVEKTALGLAAQEIMSRGELVSDEIVIGMINSKLDSQKDAHGFIFDGFPRTTAQAVALDNLLSKKGTSISAMVALEVEKNELIARLVNRAKESNRPDDQDVNIIENRINVYNEKTTPLIDYYKKQNKFKSVYGIGSVDDIFDRLCETIDTL